MTLNDVIRRIADTEYTHDPDSLWSLIEAARQIRADFRRDHSGNEGGSMSPGAIEHGARVRREYQAKGWDVVNDLALVPAPPTPAGLPSAETAATYLYGETRGRAMTRAAARDALLRGPYRLRGDHVVPLVDWLVAGGYLTELRLDAEEGQVRGIYAAGRCTAHHDRLGDEPRWMTTAMTVTRRAPWGPLRGVRTLYMHPDETNAHFAR